MQDERGPSRLAEIRNLLSKHNITPSRRLGQNFLVDLRPAELLAEKAVELASGDILKVALEIGTGLGHLTECLARRGFSVVTVELDRRLAAAAKERLSSVGTFANVTFLRADAVSKGSLSMELLGALGTALPPGGKYVLASNLPYSIASPVIVWYALHPDAWSGAVVTVQHEMAQRLTAQPGGSEWGAIGLLASVAFSEVKVLKEVKAGAFYPPPKVDSAIVTFRPARSLPIPLERLEAFGNYAKRIFSQRRKTLRKALSILDWKMPEDIDIGARVDDLNVHGHLKTFELNVK